jgi:hypothetical protein
MLNSVLAITPQEPNEKKKNLCEHWLPKSESLYPALLSLNQSCTPNNKNKDTKYLKYSSPKAKFTVARMQ